MYSVPYAIIQDEYTAVVYIMSELLCFHVCACVCSFYWC